MTGAMRFCEVLKIRVLNHLFKAAIATEKAGTPSQPNNCFY
ncbi:MAG: hypothetical protein V7K38_02705 [Nostoc sp.]